MEKTVATSWTGGDRHTAHRRTVINDQKLAIEKMWQKLKKYIREWQGVFIIAPSVAGFVIAGSLTGFFQLLEWATVDQFFRLRPTEPVDERIVIVTIDESDITNVGKWPLPDRVIAQLLKKIKAQQPRVIGLDNYRDLPVEPGHQELVQVFESTPNLIGIEKVGGNQIAPPPTLNKLGQVAASDLVVDADGKVRRALMLIGSPDGRFREGLGTKLALMYLAAENISLQTIDENKKIYQLGQAVFVPLTGNEGGYIASDTGGYQILLNFRGGIDRFPTVSITDVLENRIPPDLMRDRIVLIGTTAESLKDMFPTPYSNTLFVMGKLTPGVAIHANVASQILSAAKEGRLMLRAWTKTEGALYILVWSFAGALACLQSLQNQLFKKSIYFTGTIYTIIGGGILVIVGSYAAFLSGWIIPVFSPLLSLTFSAILLANYQSQLQLKIANERLEHANHQLAEYSHILETKVDEKTRDLKKALENLKATQAQLIHSEKMAALGQMVAGIAHEINNPTNFIFGNINYAEKYAYDLMRLIQIYQNNKQEDPVTKKLIEEVDFEFLQEDFPKVLNSIKTGANRIREIVKSLRIFSRLDEAELKSVDLHEGIESALMLLENRLKSNRIDIPSIQVIKEYGNLPEVTCYAGQLNQVFMNLLINAIDALEERQKQLSPEELRKNPSVIKIITSLKENSQVFISISDNGLGIPEAIQQRVFDPFFTTKPVGKGTGLGLSVSYSIVVEKHGGQLRLYSKPGEGTEFQIEIPLRLSTEKSKPMSDFTANRILA
ncbi:MAG: CHASE2 domain-containing protein [Oscillatoriaceae bacterium SKW80]|nr:CHASE2 domain-containing protein [Oscillatoriaceae bacterium SKW80]HIK26611.1 CHASE2 domain-containing protein [Oscillatoriaceae cyanobacterium M7585_C2015_266]